MNKEKALQDLISGRKEGLPIAVMMCGVAGSGKTTFAQQLEINGFIRLSIDEEIWASKGRYGIDFRPEEYEQLKEEAEEKLRKQMVKLLANQQSVVIDFSFWQRARREQYKKLIKEAGGEWKLVYLKVEPKELRSRLGIRNKRFDANAQFPITDEILRSFLDGFEVPAGEGEWVIEP
ncbi:ATP-binding protein [Bacillus sp. FJAT-42376]|uniref:AAA family ATPase n=1 Tax=Bacillus sp. FJAT-42376 TaxID=2014076 RepID=UPI000F514CE3|nr:ATP-binding protein [Bacillus sp. FJAT-42376]AZB41321.1 ATP-binding protein [Bacillus sp. FJAT-42376]